MRLSSAVAAVTGVATCGKVMASSYFESPLPEILTIMDTAFPKWDHENCSRIETKPCTVDSCEWNPCDVTKKYDGLHPDYGGNPTENDVKYWFFASAPFQGQPYAGTANHCALNAPANVTMDACPKIETLTDDGVDGPGHIPPHIALASTNWSVRDQLFTMEEMFDYENFGCHITPDTLLKMIRNYFPRTPGEKVVYPRPYTVEGGEYQYEFPSGRGLNNQAPPYLPGPPQWCTEEFLALGKKTHFCPYIHEGPDMGRYRRPHKAFAALEVYLANIAMPEKCHTTWLKNNPDYIDPERITTDKACPKRTNDAYDNKSFQNWIGQPVLPWNYHPGGAKDAVVMQAHVTRTYLTFGSAVASGAVTAATASATALVGSIILLTCM